MQWIEHIITTSSLLDTIIVTAQIRWNTYATAVGTATVVLWLFNHHSVIIF
jgi:hypothetical protein